MYPTEGLLDLKRKQYLKPFISQSDFRFLRDKKKVLNNAFTVDSLDLACIYFLLDGEQIVYVGQTRSSVRSRIRQHKKDKVFDRVSIIPLEERNHRPSVIEVESAYIAKFSPKYNKSLSCHNQFVTEGNLGTVDWEVINKYGIKPVFVDNSGVKFFYQLELERAAEHYWREK